jgi:Flp pilus assembly pilin Flp
MKGLMFRLVREDEGQDLIEYALLCTLVALVVGVAAQFLGTQLTAWYNAVGTTVQGWAAIAGA